MERNVRGLSDRCSREDVDSCQFGVLGTEPRSVRCKANTHQTAQSLQLQLDRGEWRAPLGQQRGCSAGAKVEEGQTPSWLPEVSVPKFAIGFFRQVDLCMRVVLAAFLGSVPALASSSESSLC